MPTLIITQGDRVTSLYETIVITNFIARLHGREIYPFNTDPVDELEIASLNTFLLTKTDQFFRAQYQMRSGSITNEQIEEIRNNLRQINALLGDSQFFGKAAIGIDEVSLADIHLFPSIERIIYINKLFCEDVLNGEVP